YTVIGVFNPPPQLFGGQPSPEAIIPHGALIKYVRYWKGWMDLLVGPAPAATTAEAILARRRNRFSADCCATIANVIRWFRFTSKNARRSECGRWWRRADCQQR